ncbi:MAG: hypothetical protein EOP47_18745 [Sphingobacteriaceae bacterium]|nr:MAG: hypothetical protein EOP47_18745 [Sphingobacteriaceae bacterium]
MIKKIFLSLLPVCYCMMAYAQSVGIGTTAPAASAQLDINSSTKGLLIPRLSSAQRTAIVNPANGLQVYDTNTNSFWFYKSSIWVEMSNPSATSGWGLNGNAGTTAANFIGTTDDVPLDIRQGNSTMAKLFSGNAFIGTGAGSNFTTGAGYDNIFLGRFAGKGITAGSDNIFIGNQFSETHKDTLNNSIGIGPVTVNESNSIKIGAYYQKAGIGLGYIENPADVLTVGQRRNGFHQAALRVMGTNYSTVFNSGNTEDVFITGGRLLGNVFVNRDNHGDVVIGANITSKIGIGTHVLNPNTRLSIQTAADYANAFSLENATGTVRFNAFLGGPNNGNTVSLGTTGNMPIVLYTNNANRFFVAGNGNIGIGTDNPTYKLSVNGNVRSKEVVVESAWADYVFDENYELRSLDAVEKFIETNKHLPGIPSAKEIQQNGLNVGELQTKMMEKIEELTLYIIQLKKELDALKSNSKNEK